MAANIQEALDEICKNIGNLSAHVVPPFADRWLDWLNTIFLVPASFPAPGDPFNPQSLDERSVFDWAIPTLQAHEQIANADPVDQRNIAINVVYRTLLAVQTAAAEGRITADQETSVVAAYTTIWE